VHALHPAVVVLDDGGAAVDPVAAVDVEDPADGAHGRGVDVAADHAAEHYGWSFGRVNMQSPGAGPSRRAVSTRERASVAASAVSSMRSASVRARSSLNLQRRLKSGRQALDAGG
jgi:hypothetical protein